MKKTLLIIAIIVLVFFVNSSFTADDWQSPTSHIDYSSEWGSETSAYDDNTGTQAYDSNVPASTWSAWLGLTISALDCDKVRFWAPYGGAFQSSAQVEVYYSSDWHSVHDGSYLNLAWQECSLGGTYEITTARIRFYNSHYTLAGMYLNEFDFNQAAAEEEEEANALFWFNF